MGDIATSKGLVGVQGSANMAENMYVGLYLCQGAIVKDDEGSILPRGRYNVPETQCQT